MHCTRSLRWLRAIALGLAVLTLTAGLACADWWIDTPSGYQGIGGASRIGPYKTYYEAQDVNNAKFNGAGHVWGSDDAGPDPDPVWQGRAVVHIINKTSRRVRYAIRKRSGHGWTWRTIACGGGYTDWIDAPAQFEIEFDHSAAKGYQRRSYNLDYKVTKLRVPTKKQARKYQFMKVAGGIDLRKYSNAPYAPCGQAGAAPKRSGSGTSERERARIERSRVARLARASDLVEQINRTRTENRALARHIARLSNQVADLEVVDKNIKLLQRLYAEEEAMIQRTKAAWDRPAAMLGDQAETRLDVHAAYTKVAREIGALRAAAGLEASPASPVFAPPPKVTLPPYEPPLEADVRFEREKSPASGAQFPVRAIPVEPPAGGPYASDAYLQGLAKRLGEARKSLTQAREQELREKTRRNELLEAQRRRIPETDKQRMRMRAGYKELRTVGLHVEDLLVDAYVDAAEEAISAHAAEWLAQKIPPPLRKQAKALSDDLKSQLQSVDHYLSTWKRLRAYAEIMKQHAAPGGHVPALFRAMNPALQLPGNEAFAADVEKTLLTRFGVFADEIQELGFPEEVNTWAGLYKTLLKPRKD